jgi:hypothetical protein
VEYFLSFWETKKATRIIYLTTVPYNEELKLSLKKKAGAQQSEN